MNGEKELLGEVLAELLDEAQADPELRETARRHAIGLQNVLEEMAVTTVGEPGLFSRLADVLERVLARLSVEQPMLEQLLEFERERAQHEALVASRLAALNERLDRMEQGQDGLWARGRKALSVLTGSGGGGKGSVVVTPQGAREERF